MGTNFFPFLYILFLHSVTPNFANDDDHHHRHHLLKRIQVRIFRLKDSQLSRLRGALLFRNFFPQVKPG